MAGAGKLDFSHTAMSQNTSFDLKPQVPQRFNFSQGQEVRVTLAECTPPTKATVTIDARNTSITRIGTWRLAQSERAAAPQGSATASLPVSGRL